jgi:NAD(P)-dependent dehydrogenase (short-subunit alcohol dehydrogenase family)
MKVIVIGGTGVIGSAVADALSGTHEVIRVARKGGDLHADIASKDLLERLFAEAAPFDAVVSCAGSGAFKPLDQLTDEDFAYSLFDKLMGQVNVLRTAAKHISNGGSITLTSGVLASEPMPGSGAISLVNAGPEGFGRAAALELRGRVRVNVVSPPWVSETLSAMGMDHSGGMPAAEVAKAYVKSVEDGSLTGQVIDARAVVSA